MKVTTLKNGEIFYCTKDFVNDNGTTLFNADDQYKCLQDGALVDEEGNDTFFENEEWDFDFLEDFNEHFVNVKDQNRGPFKPPHDPKWPTPFA